MCGRYTLATDLRVLAERFGFRASDIEYRPRYNIAPTQNVLAVTGEEGRAARLLRWGLVPSWAREAGGERQMINARAETLGQKPSFRRSLAGRRCLVLADGFYEWKKEGRRKIPMRVVLRSGEPFAFAGLWDVWREGSAEEIRSCAIITTEPNPLIRKIHDRMPVILARRAEEIWLDPSVTDPSRLGELLLPYPSEELRAYRVSPRVNSPRNDDPRCIEPVGNGPDEG